MTEREFWLLLGKISHTEGEQGEAFEEVVSDMINMLDSADMDDYFGTEGWRRDFGWED